MRLKHAVPIATFLCAFTASGCLKFSRQAQVNQPPLAAALISPEERVGPRAEVTLDASGSTDPEGRSLSYTWKQVSGDVVWASDQRTAVATFLAPERPQTLLFSLQVSDGAQVSEAVLVRIEVSTNSAPTAAITLQGAASAGSTLSLDGSGSSDPEVSPLTYSWRSTSHPSIVFIPDAQAVAPSVVVPNDFDQDLVFELVVSDGRLASAPVTATTRIEPGNSTHYFVDADATCTSCDGTREAPFTAIASAVAANVTTPRPILVAGGFYPHLTLATSAHIRGGCAPSDGWVCGQASSRTVLTAADDRYATVEVTGTTTDVTLEHLTLIGSYGLTTMVDHSSVVQVDDASITMRHVDMEAHGVGPYVDSTTALSAKLSLRVHLFDSTLLGGRSRENHTVDVTAVNDLWIDHSTLKSKPDPRNGFLPPTLDSNHREIEVFRTHGGRDHLITHSTLIGDANSEVQSLTELRSTTGSLEPNVTVMHSVIWHKGQASGDVFVGPDAGRGRRRHNANRMVHIDTGGRFTFINNTFIGNPALADPTGALCAQRGLDGCACPAGFDPVTDCECPDPPLSGSVRNYACLGLHAFMLSLGGRVEVINSYFQDIHFLAYSQSTGGRTATFRNNTFSNVRKYEGGDNLMPSTDISKVSDGYQDPGNSMFGSASQAGENNVAGDCELADASAGDAHIGAGSICEDTGAFEPRATAQDRDLNPYPAGAGPDRGAYEVQP